MLRKLLLISPLLILLLILATVASNIKFNNEKWLDDKNPFQLEQEYIKDTFATNDDIIIAIQPKNDIFHANTISDLSELTKKITAIKYVKSVQTPLNVKTISNNGDSINIVKFADLDSNEYRNKLPLSDYYGLLVSKDYKSIAIVIKLNKAPDNNIKYKRVSNILTQIEDILAGYNSFLDYKIAGESYLYNMLNVMNKDNLMRILPLSLLMAIFSLFLIHRDIIKIGIILFSTSISIFSSLSIIVMMNQTITIISMILPVMIIVIAITDSIHIVTRWKILTKQYRDRHIVIKHLISQTWKPCFLTSITTSIGFGSFYFSEILPLKNFALISIIAIISTFILVSICNWLCLFVFHDNLAKNREFKSHVIVTKIIESLYQFNSNYRKKILVAVICITLTALVGLKNIYKETNFLDSFFVSSSNIYQDFIFLDKELSGSSGLNILFKVQKQGQFKNIESLKMLNSLETELLKHESIKYVRSYLNPVKMIHQGFASDNSKIPQTQAELEQELLFLEFSKTDSSDDILSQYINFDYSAMQMRLYTNNLNSRKTEQLISFISKTLDNMQIEASITGANMYTHTLGNYVINTQVTSIIITLLAIALVIYIFLGIKSGILCLITNSVPIIILVGAMGYLGIPIDFSTILIIGISLGIAVDNNIHFLHLYQNSNRLGQHYNHLYYVIHIVGRPIIYTTMLLSLCIGVFVISDLFILAKFGLFTVIAILLSALCSFVLLPLLIEITESKID